MIQLILRVIWIVPILAGLCACQTLPPAAACSASTIAVGELAALKADGFLIADDAERQKLARGILPCLASADPDIRDGTAYEAYFTWLRAGKLEPVTIQFVREELVSVLEQPANEAGFHQPFAALVLAEVARADRVAPYLAPRQRAELVDVSTRYLLNISDYRGYDESVGWRHGVAHAADLLMQLSLNPAITPGQLSAMLDAIGEKIAPDGHFYTYGEPLRLARPVFFIAQRDELSADKWTRWFAQLADPDPFEDWNVVYRSQRGLAKLHNTRSFATALFPYVVATEDDPRENLQPLADGVRMLLGVMP